MVMQRKQTRAVMPLRALTHLSLSLSDPEVDSQVEGLQHVLEICPDLEVLAIHQFSIGARYLPGTRYNRAARGDEAWKLPQSAEQNLTSVFGSALSAEQLPRLKSLSLDGVYTTGEGLTRFVQRTTPLSIRLQQIKLVTGNYKALLDYCTSEASPVTRLDLKDLYEDGLKVTFDSNDSYDLCTEGDAAKVSSSYHAGLCPITRSEVATRIRQLYGPF